MGTIGKNIISNLGLQFWITLSQLVLVPFYIHQLGVESYGLVGFYTALMGVFFLLDFGFSAVVGQEWAKSGQGTALLKVRADLIRTFEILFIGLALIGVGLIIGFREYYFSDMLRDSKLGEQQILQCIWAMAILLAVRLPIGLYSSAIAGLEKQLKLNVYLIGIDVIKVLVSVVVILWFWKSILAFFVIHIIFSVITLFALRMIVYHEGRISSFTPEFHWSLVSSRLKFTVGVSLISIFAVLVTQLDKFFLARMVSLEDLGYYTLAYTIAGLPGKVVFPIANATYPRMVREYHAGNPLAMDRIYQKSSQLISLIIVPLSMAVFFFTEPLLNIWFQDALLVEKIEGMVKIFILGWMIHGMMTMPYFLEITYQWTSLSIIKNALAFIAMIPVLTIVIQYTGIEGACFLWLVLNLTYLCVEIPILHRRINKGKMWRWYLYTVVIPVGISSVVFFLLREALNLISIVPILELVIMACGLVTLLILINRLLPERPLWAITQLVRR